MGVVSYSAVDFWPHNTVLYVTDFRGNDPRFVYYFLQWLNLRRFDSGSAQATLNRNYIYPISVCTPPLSEQRAIAATLGALEQKIDLNRRMCETLEAMAQALFKSWFVDFDPVRAKAEGCDTGLPSEIAGLFSDSFQESQIGEIPTAWRLGTLGEVAEHPRRGVNPTEIDSATAYIALEHMPKRSIALQRWGTAESVESNKFEFKKGEILFGKLRPYFHKVGVAPINGICSTDIVVVAPRGPGWFGFVLGHVSSDAFVEYTNAGSTGTRMPRTSWSEMARYSVALPPETISEVFTKLMEAWVERLHSSIHESRTLAAVRDTLLPKLLSGELRVKDAERFVAAAT
jgi:type I restriction enzyme S subunit